jgi:light-regulated signal transduction histidine kinase (bacteriophytochrome)
MTAVVREVCADRAQTSASNTQFSVGSLPESLCDGVLLRCVWEQLVDNAVKFSSERAEATVTIDGRIEGARAIYRVEDNGAGFDMQYYDRLFCLFGRLHGSDRFAGTGVGLAIVERALSRHGGSVWAQSNPNAGATFFFALPAARGKNAPENYR